MKNQKNQLRNCIKIELSTSQGSKKELHDKLIRMENSFLKAAKQKSSDDYVKAMKYVLDYHEELLIIEKELVKKGTIAQCNMVMNEQDVKLKQHELEQYRKQANMTLPISPVGASNKNMDVHVSTEQLNRYQEITGGKQKSDERCEEEDAAENSKFDEKCAKEDTAKNWEIESIRSIVIIKNGDLTKAKFEATWKGYGINDNTFESMSTIRQYYPGASKYGCFVDR